MSDFENILILNSSTIWTYFRNLSIIERFSKILLTIIFNMTYSDVKIITSSIFCILIVWAMRLMIALKIYFVENFRSITDIMQSKFEIMSFSIVLKELILWFFWITTINFLMIINLQKRNFKSFDCSRNILKTMISKSS